MGRNSSFICSPTSSDHSNEMRSTDYPIADVLCNCERCYTDDLIKRFQLFDQPADEVRNEENNFWEFLKKLAPAEALKASASAVAAADVGWAGEVGAAAAVAAAEAAEDTAAATEVPESNYDEYLKMLYDSDCSLVAKTSDQPDSDKAHHPPSEDISFALNGELNGMTYKQISKDVDALVSTNELTVLGKRFGNILIGQELHRFYDVSYKTYDDGMQAMDRDYNKHQTKIIADKIHDKDAITIIGTNTTDDGITYLTLSHSIVVPQDTECVFNFFLDKKKKLFSINKENSNEVNVGGVLFYLEDSFQRHFQRHFQNLYHRQEGMDGEEKYEIESAIEGARQI